MLPKTLLGMAEPPGGWTGPFGFLRIVAMCFIALALMMSLASLWAIYEGDNLTSIVFCLMLSFAASMAAAAAYSHEGLANQVSKMARHNDEYSALNDGFNQQTNDLQKVAERIEQLLDGNEEKLEEFKKQMATLDQLSSLNQVSTITRAFIDAQMRNMMHNNGGMDGRLDQSEVLEFLRGAKSTLQERIPKFDIDELAKAAYHPGMSLMDIELLLAAVTTDGDEEKACFMGFLYFLLHPRKPGTIQEVTRCLKIHFKEHPKWGKDEELTAEIARLANTTPEEANTEEAGLKRYNRISVEEARELSRAVLHTFQKDCDHDLGISDDEDGDF